MSDRLGIFNLAASYLGSEPLAALADDTKTALALNAVYEQSRDRVLADHPWNCAVRRVTLTLNAATPLFGYAYAYDLPDGSDPAAPLCLRVLGLVGGFNQNPEDDPANVNPQLLYKVEAGLLLTDASPAQIKYIAQITDESGFEAGLVEAIALRLAAQTAWQITGDRALKDSLDKEYLVALSKAKSANAQEGSPEVAVSSTWADARL